MSNFRQLRLGAPYALAVNSNAFNSYTFANTTDQIEWIFQVPDPGDGTRTVTITRLGYRLSSVNGTSPLMKISLQGVDGAGNPDGTIKSSSGAVATFTPAGTATWNWVTLGSSYTASVGEFLAIVIGYQSGTLNSATAAPLIAMNYLQNNQYLPYAIQNVAGSRSRQVGIPVMGFGSAGKAFGFPVQALTTTIISTPSERALRFVLDQAFVQTYKVVGVRFCAQGSAVGRLTNVTLYSGTTVLQTVAWDSDVAEAAAVLRAYDLWFQDATLATLVGGQEYRIAMSPTDLTNNIGLQTIDMAAAADLDALPGGQTWYLSTRASQGATAWTDVLTSRPVMELIIGDWTAPARGIIG